MSKSLLSLLFVLSSFVVGVSQEEAKSAAKLYNEGFSLLKEKKYAEGLPLLEEALAKAEEEGNEKVVGLAKKNGAVAAYNVGNGLRKEGKLDEAMTFYEKGAGWNPEKSNNIGGIAMILDKQGKKVEAMKKYIEAAKVATAAEKIKRAKKFTKQASNIVGKFYTSKDHDKAVEAGNLFISMDDTNADVHYYVSRSQSEKEDFDNALANAEKAITLAGETVPDKYYVAKGLALEGQNNNVAAVEAYKMITGEKYKKLADSKIANLQK